MRYALLVALALAAGAAAAQGAPQPDPRDPSAKVPPAAYHSALDGYRPFAEQELADWRRANEAVGAAGSHAGHRPDQGPGRGTSKPQPGKPESSGGPAEKGPPAHQGHGGHK